jgi:tetratricopeptide (TPR) repeat protein
VLQDTLEKAERHWWAERATFSVNAAFPEVEHGTWPQCERLLPQALTTTQFIEQYQIICEEAGRLLHETVSYLRDRARYAEAESLSQRALRVWEQHLGSEHPDMAHPLNFLAILYSDQGKYAQAEPLFQRALRIHEQHLGPEHLQVAYPLNDLASLYRELGDHAQAELLYQRALHIREQALEPEHPNVADTMHELAQLREAQDNSEEARVFPCP